MHEIAVLALDGLVPFDLTIPVAVFQVARFTDGSPAYNVRVCGVSSTVDAGVFALQLQWGLEALEEADTIIVPGRKIPMAPTPEEVIRALQVAAERGARIASICTGAFVLAAAGLLDGMRATTHWGAASELALNYPDIQVDPGLLYVDGGQLLTSAGSAAGLDLCLHIVRGDYGSAVAADAARRIVMPLERDGGQAQYIIHEPPELNGSSLEPLLRWMAANLHLQLSLSELATRSMLSTRTLMRRFREQTGTTPLQWMHSSRLRQAQYLLEETNYSMDQIASQVGFGTPANFRDRFRRGVGTSPQAYRRAFRGSLA